MPDIQVADVGRKLRDRYRLTGPPPAPFLGPELVPVVLVDDLTGLDVYDRAFLRPAVAWDTQTSGANPGVNDSAVIQFVNPTNSGVLAVLEFGVFGNPTSAGEITITGPTSTSNSPDKAAFWRDSRLDGTPVCGTRGFNQGISLKVVPRYYISSPGETPQDRVELPWVLEPGFALFFVLDHASSTVQASIYWRERAL